MYYLDQKNNLAKVLANLPENVLIHFGDFNAVDQIWDIGKKFNLTYGEMGNICEIIEGIITEKTRTENLLEEIKKILGEDNRDKGKQITSEIEDQILVKILPHYSKTNSQLVPNPHESIKPAIPTYQELQTEENPNISETIYEKISREQILRDLENPPPAKFSSSNSQTKKQPEEIKKEEKPKENRSTEAEEAKDTREVPIMHTMSRDITQKSGGELPKIIAPSIKSELPFIGGLPRGKFGTGSVPQVRQMTFTSNSSFERKNEVVKNDIQIKREVPVPKTEAPINLPIEENQNIPVPPTPKVMEIPKTNTPINPTEDKLTKRVHTPIERKSYNIDPYRESLE